jgi:PII-like signaling protein
MPPKPLNGNVLLARIFLGESDRWQGSPLYEALVLAARKDGIAGATVLRGMMGYGANKHFHAATLLELSGDLPIVVEMVDNEESIRAFLKRIEPMVEATGCLITLESIEIYRHHPSPARV